MPVSTVSLRALPFCGSAEPDSKPAPDHEPARLDSPARRRLAAECVLHQPNLYGLALRLTRNHDDSLDLVQETFLRAMIAWRSFAPGSNLRAWLSRILTNAFINGYRKRRRQHAFAAECPGDARRAYYGDDEEASPHPVQHAARMALSDEVTAALAQLAPEYREVVERADLRGEKYRTIADDLGLPIGTVMSRLFRARRQLEGQLKAYAATDYNLKRAA